MRHPSNHLKKPSDAAVGREVCGDAAPDSSFGQWPINNPRTLYSLCTRTRLKGHAPMHHPNERGCGTSSADSANSPR
jgi:hypothetical protein